MMACVCVQTLTSQVLRRLGDVIPVHTDLSNRKSMLACHFHNTQYITIYHAVFSPRQMPAKDTAPHFGGTQLCQLTDE